MDEAPVLPMPAEPSDANATTEAGIATSRHNAAMAANRGFMITVSCRAGLHSLTCSAANFWGKDVGKQRRNVRLFSFLDRCCSNATRVNCAEFCSAPRSLLSPPLLAGRSNRQ